MKRIKQISGSACALLLALTPLCFIGCDQDEKTEGAVLILEPESEEIQTPPSEGTLGMAGNGDEAMNAPEGESMAGAGGAGGEMVGMEGMGGTLGMDGPGGNTGGGSLPGTCSESGYEAQRETLSEDDDGVIRYLAFNTNPDARNSITDVLLVEFHPSRGFPEQAGTYDLAEVGADINSCQICVLSFQDIDVRNGNRRMNLMATEGQIEITQWPEIGDNLEATFQDVVFRQVNITRNQLQQLVQEVVPNGFSLCTDDHQLSATRMPRPAMVGEEIEDMVLLNCETEEWVHVREIAAQTKAIWLLGTAGWCGACRNLMLNGDRNARQVGPPLQMAAEAGPDNLRVMVVLGEDPNRGPATMRYCKQYASSYADDAADFYLDHDGARSFPMLFGFLNIYASDDGMFGLPWNGVVSGGANPTFVYADRSGQPERLGQIIDSLVTGE